MCDCVPLRCQGILREPLTIPASLVLYPGKGSLPGLVPVFALNDGEKFPGHGYEITSIFSLS